MIFLNPLESGISKGPKYLTHGYLTTNKNDSFIGSETRSRTIRSINDELHIQSLILNCFHQPLREPIPHSDEEY